MTRDEALKKIKKCLALARGASDHEAAAAMRQAQKLMQEFGLCEQDVSLADVSEVQARASSSAANLWEVRLAKLVASAFGCEMFTQSDAKYTAGRWMHKRVWVFVGVDAAATIAAYACEVLVRQCATQRMAYIGQQPRNCKQRTKSQRGDMFAMGWVIGVADKVPATPANPETKALLRTYIQQKYPDMTPGQARNTLEGSKQSQTHLAAGYQAGQSAQLHPGVGGQQPIAMLTR